nr:immunoglobulin light chain junction region [Macaca mulatta]MOV78012.1 immunoglobulin light chain junction region [Macaca mulatta]MOV78252.1 immunoglobulin light chain junction region [Macaca mulatta]MOV78260.1 immunoglobulin light chain junction region [Macaca mulatta]MOV78861.1 immunoglobulin light chain junction region [Macaca mulatta]
CGQGTQLPPTF